MKIAAVTLFVLCAAPLAAAPVTVPIVAVKPVAVAKLPSAVEIVETEGQFVFTDGSSYYVFKKDGTFKLRPIGRSGREIDGTWKPADFGFEIDGNWTWINGMTYLDDHRKMVLVVYPYKTFKAVPSLSWALGEAKIYDCYFEIEELVKLPQPSIPSPK